MKIAIHQIAMRYHIDPLMIMERWTMRDLNDAFEAMALTDYYLEQELERR